MNGVGDDMTEASKIAVVTVHGTGDTAEGPAGAKWFQQGSQFSEHLRARLQPAGLDADIIPVLWSGANSAAAREKGADKLTQTLKRLHRKYESVHVIGHSHGGNVANESALHTRWGMGRSADKFDSLITVGTPFLNQRTGLLHTFAGLLFLAITYGSVLVFPIIALAWFAQDGAPPPLHLFAGYVVGIGGCTLLMLAMARRGIRRVLRPSTPKQTSRSIFALWHDNDEAISFLKRIEEVPIEPFPRGAMFRGSHSGAVSWAVLAVIFVGLVVPGLYMFGLADVFGMNETASVGLAGDIVATAGVGLILAPAIFVIVYLIYRAVIGGASELVVRQPMNGVVQGALRGIAMGRDGDQKVGEVSTVSHTHQTEIRVLDGDVAQRMQAAAGAAADKLIEKYRWSIFTIGSDTNTPLSKMAEDAMTWDSLIHTTYFDQPEVVDIIAAHIAAHAKRD